LRVAAVLPRLVVEPARAAPSVLDEAVAVEVARLVDPGECVHRRLAEAAHERGVVSPAPDLREQDQVERRRVDRSVVIAEPARRSFPVPDLVDDLPRLRVELRIVLGRLEVREHLERAAGELRPEQQRLQARDQRVPPEYGHEPRHPGRGQRAEAVADPQRGEVGNRTRERMVQVVPRRAQLWDAELPGGQRLAYVD
jgi:hypothetical protein